MCLINESRSLYGLMCITQFQQLFEVLGSDELHRLICADVREPLDNWFGLLAARIIAACLGCRPGDAVELVSKMSFLIRKLFQAFKELWSADCLHEFLMNRGFIARDDRMLHFVCV